MGKNGNGSFIRRSEEIGILNPPGIILEDAKYGVNVGNIVRAASCFGIESVVFTGTRVFDDISGRDRLPREERMRGYKEVQIINSERPLDLYVNARPVIVELVPGAIPLSEFNHPLNAVYVFGPEDGSVSKALRVMGHYFVKIETRHCLNLATAVAIVLWSRAYYRNRMFGTAMPELQEGREYVADPVFEEV